MPAPASRSALLTKRLERFTRLLHGVEEGDVKAVHRTRVASRRLRELLPVLQLDGDEVHKLGRRLRKVTSHLGSVRELDVLLQLIDELHESRRYSPTALGVVADDVARAHAEARDQLLRRLPKAELHRVAHKLERTAEAIDRAEREPRERAAALRACRWAIEARLAKRATALSAAMQAAGAVYLPERLHAVRIALKKLRYALELANDVTGGSAAADLKTLKRIQELLGRMHDMQVLIARVRALQPVLPRPDFAIRRDLDALVASLENNCRRLHARYVRERAAIEAICERVGPKAEGASRRSVRAAV
jgi:CHAD domain-containing protein